MHAKAMEQSHEGGVLEFDAFEPDDVSLSEGLLSFGPQGAYVRAWSYVERDSPDDK